MLVNKAMRLLQVMVETKGTEETIQSKQFLGAGCGREAYSLDDDHVVKIPRYIVTDVNRSCYRESKESAYAYGVEQMTTEIAVWEDATEDERELLNPVVAHGEYDGTPFIVAKKVQIAEGIYDDIRDFSKTVEVALAENFETRLGRLCDRHGIDFYDCYSNTGNFGLTKDGRIVITDYGLN